MILRAGFALLIAATAAFAGGAPPSANGTSWKHTLLERIPLYGHRNWIVIADSAYPAQSREGIETIVSNASELDVLREVLADLSASKHVRPIVYTDQELKYVEEKDVPGISAYRQQLGALLRNQKVNAMLHEQIISKLDEVSRTFRVLIIKTNMTMPYTSVFLQLGPAYWSADQETRLRSAMAKHHPAK